MAKTKLASKNLSANLDVYVTASGLKDAKTEIEFLKNVRRQEVSLRIENARESGAIEENSEYDAAIEEQALVEHRIAYLEEMIGHAKLISTHTTGEVVVGSTVRVKIEEKLDEYMIVGKLEANPMKKKISNESPLGQALLGAKVGEEVEVTTPQFSYRCKVVEIN